MTDRIPELRPRIGALDWTPAEVPPQIARMALSAACWRSGDLQVFSTVEMLDDEHEPPHPEYHLSVVVVARGALSRAGRQAVRKVLRDFRAEDALEDNHVPDGKVRNFWRHVRQADHHACPCQETEPSHVIEIAGDDPDAYVWRQEG